MYHLHLTIPLAWDNRTIKQFLRGELLFSMHQISRIKYRPTGFLVNGETRYVNDILHAGDDLCFAIDDPLPEEAFLSEGVSCRPQEEISVFKEVPYPAKEIPVSKEVPCPAKEIPVSKEVPCSLPVLYEDNFILAVSKPAGMVSHPSHGHHGDSALDLLQKRYGRLYLIGRLDKDTSGILLFARHMETASLLSKQKESGSLYKIYHAIVYGIPDPPCGTIAAPISIAQENPLKMKADPAWISNKENAEAGNERSTGKNTGAHTVGKPAATHYRILRTYSDAAGRPCSVLSVTIEHGRTHQIRVHLSSVGYPLVGDRLYGTTEFGNFEQSAESVNTRDSERSGSESYAQLRAVELHFIHPYTKEEITVHDFAI